MKVTINKSGLTLVKGDITDQETDAIVNAANEWLIPGGGVDGAIHRKGGPCIKEETDLIGGCKPGNAVISNAGNLKARYVIHAVGPMYDGGKTGEPQLLKSAYRESLKLADANGLKSISFPSLSTGAFGYPLEEAVPIALETVIEYLNAGTGIGEVRFVLFDDRTYDAYEKTLREWHKA